MHLERRLPVSKRYFENFDGIDSVHANFGIPSETVKDEEVLYAYYGYGCYCGSATVLFQRDGKLYEELSSHCSCYGLENTWSPEEVTWDQLAVRNLKWRFEDDKDGEAYKALQDLINQHAPRA